MIDIVFPNNNESDFIKIAQALGISGLVFVYKDAKDFFVPKAQISIKIFNALIASPNQFEKARKFSKLVFCKGEENNTEIIERKPDIVFSIEEMQKRDHLHYRFSGVNQVLCRLAVKNKVVFGFSFSSLFNKNPFVKAQIFGRMMQNISLFRKFKNDFCIASFADDPWKMRAPKDVASLFVCFGMHPQEVHKAFTCVLERIM